MNYCVVAFAIILIIASLTWIFDGRKNYTGPQLDIDAMLNGEVEGIDGKAEPGAGNGGGPAESGEEKRVV